MTEINCNWTQMDSDEQLHQQMRGWWKNKTLQRSWLKTSERIKYQTGGTATVLTGDMPSYRQESGEDKKTWVDGHGRLSKTPQEISKPQSSQFTNRVTTKALYQHILNNLKKYDETTPQHQMMYSPHFDRILKISLKTNRTSDTK